MTDMRSEIRGWYSELYVRIKNDAPKQKTNQAPKAMLRFLRILGGTVALSPFHTCTPAKAIPSTPATTKSATILPVQNQSIEVRYQGDHENGASHHFPSGISTLPIVMREADI